MTTLIRFHTTNNIFNKFNILLFSFLMVLLNLKRDETCKSP